MSEEIKARILYYSNAFIAFHGGRLHSEAFLEECMKNPDVETIIPYPQPKSKSSSLSNSNKNIRTKLKRNSYLQIFFFKRRNRKSLKEIIPVIKAEKPNILHIRLDSNFLIIKDLKKIFPKLLITTEVNASPFDENFQNIGFSSYFRNSERKMLERTDANFFVSDYLRKNIMENLDPNRDFVAHNGVRDEFFNNHASMIERDTFVFGYIGTIDYHKNLNKLIDSFEVVYKKHSTKVRLIIIGDGPLLKELKEYVQSKTLNGGVDFKGWLDHEKISLSLSEIDVAIHHSAKPYMSPLKLFEYLAAGKAVIGPDTPAVREIFNEEHMIFVKENLNDLSEKMEFIYLNQDFKDSISRNGRKLVSENFRWKNNADTIVSVMKKKLNENP